MSDPARNAGRDWLETCLTGGDDYELLLAVPPAREAALRQAASRAGMAVTRIGAFHPGAPAVMVLGSGRKPLAFKKGGWSHF